MKILLVEDNNSIADIYKRVLEDEGLEVMTVSDGLLAQQTIREGNWDLLLLDVMLPKMDGLSLLKELKSNTVLADKPVLIISNVTDPAFVTECKSYGIKEYIVKAEVLPSDIVDKVKSNLPLK